MNSRNKTTNFLRIAAETLSREKNTIGEIFTNMVREAREVAWSAKDIEEYPAIDIFEGERGSFVLVAIYENPNNANEDCRDCDVIFFSTGG